MKRSVLLVILLVSLLLNGGFVIHSWRAQTVISVPDGDSLQLRDSRRVRLLGVDAPEKGRCMSNEARELLSYLARGKHVRLKDIVTDDYGRVLAIVIIEDLPTWIAYLQGRVDPLVNRVMLSSGLARSTGSATGEYAATLKVGSEAAKGKNLGIYSAECRKTVAPGGCEIKGNIREGKPVYYFPSCKYYDQVIVDEAFGDQWFCSTAEAQKAGFTPAPSCK